MRYFVNPAKRLVRTVSEGDRITFKIRDGADGDWLETSSKGYDQFVANTAAYFTPKQLREIRSGAKTFVQLCEDQYDEGAGPFDVWLLGVASGIGYVGPISRTKNAAKKWAKDNGYICVEDFSDAI